MSGAAAVLLVVSLSLPADVVGVPVLRVVVWVLLLVVPVVFAVHGAPPPPGATASAW
jgi:hypothetical protein